MKALSARAFGFLGWCGLIFGAACGSDSTPGLRTGVALDVDYDSSLPVADLMIVLSGAREIRQTLEAPLFLEPPGVRRAHFDLDVDPMLGPDLLVHVDGRAAMTMVVGSGETEVQLESGRLVPASITLGQANPCGPGGCPRCGNQRVEGTEQCDDGNQVDGDACNSDCSYPNPVIWTYEVEALAPVVSSNPNFEPIPDATLRFVPGSVSERWLIFLSGRLTSTSEAEVAAEVALTINGHVVDVMGHQVMGGTADAWAGFLSFDLVQSSTGAVVITPQFRAADGETSVADVRVIAARVPEGAELEVTRSDQIQELTGVDVEVARLSLTPSRPGPYLILAQMGVSEAPGDDTAQAWLADENGQPQPYDSRGVSFANGREPLLPMLVALKRDLTGPADFTLRGDSSATNPDGWWDTDWSRRAPIEINTDSALPAGTQISLSIDHAALIARGLSRPDGADLRVVYMAGAQPVEIDRVLDDDSGWAQADTRIWFKTSADMALGQGQVEYQLYYGRADAAPAPADPSVVFAFYDDFEGGQLDNRWVTSGASAVQLANGHMVLGPGTNATASYTLADGWLIETRASVVSTVDVNRALYFAGGMAVTGTPEFGFLMENGNHSVIAGGVPTAYTPTAPDSLQRYRLTRLEGSVRLHQNFTEVGRGALLDVNTPSRIGMANEAGAILEYAWIRARRAFARAPTTALLAEDGLAGTSPSRFAYPRILAMRLDAFPAAATTFDDALVATSASDPTVLSRLDTPPASAESDLLVIQALRVAGASSSTGRKNGLLTADSQPLLETSHRINRDASANSGYHHVAGVVDVRRTSAGAHFENAIRSPDGINVEGAASAIVVLRYPR